jgi:hypothetical protein
MSATSTPPSPQLFFETINAFHKTGALKAAIELGLFTAIGNTPSTTAEIATKCQCPERGIRILSDYLTLIGFLTKEDSRYALTPIPPPFSIAIRPLTLGAPSTSSSPRD